MSEAAKEPPVFSVLIPSIFERLDSLRVLTTELERQIEENSLTGVELVSVIDNRIISIGAKRQAVLDASHGRYVAYVDDDDWVLPDYLSSITQAIREHAGVDVITFKQHSYVDSEQPAVVTMQLGNPNEEHNPVAYRRAAWHVNAWRAGLAKQFRFPDAYYSEDWAWAAQCNAAATSSHHLDKALHVYRFSSAKSRAYAPV